LTSQASRIAGEPQIIIEPHAYWEAAWWHTPQVENIESLLAWVRQRYNVDEARTYVTGISDGGTGVYFQALREPNRWAVCAPLNGHPLVLSNRDARIDGNLYLGNLASCPLYIVNGDRDPLYPAASVAPVVAAMRAAGAVPVFLIKMNAAHDTRWWPEERASYEAFLHAHPRAAHPDRVTWETDRVDRFNRARWLVIDALGSRPTDRTLPDVNRATDPDGTSVAIFPRRRQVPSGRADVVRIGNRFEVETRGVAQFTLLVSPSVIDFSRSVEVVVNGRRVFEGSLTRDLAALMRWAARDDDRTQLYGAELHVQVP
jgi:dienelactone hydrolase